jgi:endoglycosylceramidase
MEDCPGAPANLTRMRAGGLRLAVAAAVAVLAQAVPAIGHPDDTDGRLPWLHVAHPAGQRPVITDSAGRTVMLRGANLRGLEDDFYPVPGGGEPGTQPQYPVDPAAYDGTCPPARPGAGEPPTCEVYAGRPEYQQPSSFGSGDDLAEIRAQGFDFIRLTLSWSLLEPTPGVYSQLYLDRISQVVEWAREQGIYVLLDMHQDNYSRFIPDQAPLSAGPLAGSAPEQPNHADGAPPWAVITSGVPSEALAGQGEFNAAVQAAFTAFWLNQVPTGSGGQPLPQGAAPGPGLEDHYLGAMAALVDRFKEDSTVAGYEIMNEPLPGFIAPVAFSSAFLYPFYARVVNALTARGVNRQSFFFEPMAIRNLEDAPDQAPLPFSSYSNLVYAPHDYTHVFTIDREAGIAPSQSPYPVSYDQPYQVADAEARSFGAALVCGEFNEFGNDPATYNEVVGGTTAAQDRFLVGSTYWAWTGDPVPPLLTRVYPRATAGSLTSFAYDPSAKAFQMAATATVPVRVGDRSFETDVVIPSAVPGAVAVSGAAVLDQVVANPDGTRSAFVAPTGAGAYEVRVS